MYNVSSVVTNSGGDSGKRRKVSKGETGVELRYYKPAEYRKLNSSQIDELRQWRKDNGLVKPKDGGSKNSMKDQVIAAIREISKQTAEKDKEDEAIRHIIASISTDSKINRSAQSIGAVRSAKGLEKESKVSFDESTINAIVKHLK